MYTTQQMSTFLRSATFGFVAGCGMYFYVARDVRIPKELTWR